MKKILILSLIPLLFTACDGDDTLLADSDSLVGTWQLEEQLADPGDGSGTFRDVDSDKVLVFRSNLTVASNGNLCFMSTEADETSEGSYDPEQGTLIGSECDTNLYFPISYEIVDGKLILNFPCIEPCSQKYKKITDAVDNE